MKHQGLRNILICSLIAIHVVTIYGCAVTNVITVPGNEIPVGSNLKIATVVLKNGELIAFDRSGGQYVEKTADGKSKRVIVGMANGKNVEIDPEKALEVRFEQTESSGTGSFIAGLLLGIAVSAGVVVLLFAASSH